MITKSTRHWKKTEFGSADWPANRFSTLLTVLEILLLFSTTSFESNSATQKIYKSGKNNLDIILIACQNAKYRFTFVNSYGKRGHVLQASRRINKQLIGLTHAQTKKTPKSNHEVKYHFCDENNTDTVSSTAVRL